MRWHTPGCPEKDLVSASIGEQDGRVSPECFADAITSILYRSETDECSRDGR
jgi:hypothetical protein